MKNLCQLWIFDRGTPDLDVQFVLSRDPLKNAPSLPSKTLRWEHGNTDYFVAYWHKPQSAMNDESIKEFAQRGLYLK